MLKTLKQYFAVLMRKRAYFFLYIITALIASIIANLDPYVYKLLVDAIPEATFARLLGIIALFAAVRLVGNNLNVLSYYIGDKSAIPGSNYLKEKIFNHVQTLDWSFHANKRTGSLISAFKRGDGAFWALFLNMREVFGVIVAFLVGLFFFSRLSLWLLFAMSAVFVANFTAGYFLIRRNVKARKKLNEKEDEVTGIIADNFLNYETVKYFSGEERERKRLRQKLDQLIAKTWQYANSFRIMDLTVGSISVAGMFVILFISLRRLKAGLMTGGDLVMVASFASSFYYQSFHLLYQSRNIAKSFTDLERYLSLLEKRPLVQDPTHPQEIKDPKGSIIFENVTFDYPQGKEEAIRDLDLTIEPGEVVAFAGKSGAGKTTLVKLLFRLYNLREGRILIDGVDIKNLRKKELRNLIGIVPQEPILFNSTIRFNIAFASPEASLKDIERATRIANIYDFIQTLPDKLETRVGERGIKLSGGQKQRLAIARMMLANPKIIVFDEATSQLDSESEALIQEALWRVAENRTVLIIAHRFSTILGADTIVVLEDGRIVEKGSHRELIQKQGVYHSLWKLQSIQ